jgi:hypothetical protein
MVIAVIVIQLFDYLRADATVLVTGDKYSRRTKGSIDK